MMVDLARSIKQIMARSLLALTTTDGDCWRRRHRLFKLALVEYNYNAIYGENAKKYVDRVRSAIVDLFVEYGGELYPSFVLVVVM
ncbi:hypothetical protein ACH5RR_014391 [Cinchona calisaya]|uniref:Cytochrome P450 n=1 Tax=Cinchona calisaya TaxID=153742 RepID=A0ABD3A2Q7_9GENT